MAPPEFLLADIQNKAQAQFGKKVDTATASALIAAVANKAVLIFRQVRIFEPEHLDVKSYHHPGQSQTSYDQLD